MLESSIRIEDCELSTIIFEREEIKAMLNKLLDEALNSRWKEHMRSN